MTTRRGEIGLRVASVASALLVTPGLFAAGRAASHPAAGADEADDEIARGERLVRESQCSRCHGTGALPGIDPAPREQSCSGCHAWIHATADDDAARARYRRQYPLWDRYADHVKSYLAVPDLAAAARLRPEWIARFVRHPYKVRPGFGEAMIRVPLAERDAAAVAAYIGSRAAPLLGVAREAASIPPSAAPGDVAEGQRLFARLQCARCHALGQRAAEPGIADAPDLGHARDRMTPAAIAAFIADPPALAAGGEIKMPSYGLPARDAARLRDFILAAGGGAVIATATTEGANSASGDLPLLDRRVTWKDVSTAVFARICTHCHSDGRTTGGDGGPGNTGGLGYPGARLDLGTWRAVVRGAVRDGRRVSILAPPPNGGEAPLVVRLRARMVEHAREVAPRAFASDAPGAVLDGPGMPLGLPPLSPADFQLVRTWVAQGARGPGGVTGVRPGQPRAVSLVSRR